MADDPTQLLTPEAFASKIKAKFPDYAHIPDQELTQKVLFKYPEYAPKVRLAPVNRALVQPVDVAPKQEALIPGKKFGGKVGDVIEKGLDVMGGKKLGEFEQQHPRFGPSMQMASGMSGITEDVATIAMKEIANAGSGVRAAMPAAKAAQGFQDVHMVAKDLPVNTTQARKLAEIAAKEAEFGGKPPAVIEAFLKRTENPNNPVTYAEARKFYSNASRLSDAEAGATNSVMRRHMARFTKALGPAIENTTEQVGKLDTYKDAMKNYKTAMRLKSGADFLKKHGAKALITGALGAAGYGLYEATKK